MTYILIALLFLIGICIGSFINAWVWRFYQLTQVRNYSAKRRRDYSVLRGRSMCPTCSHRLQWRDLIPLISWIALRGKCRYCETPISVRYPVMELIVGLMFVFSYLVWPLELSNAADYSYFGLWLAYTSVLAALSLYDVQHRLLPNRMVVIAALVSATALVLRVAATQSLVLLVWSVFAALVFGGLFYVLFQASAGTWIGGGDVKLGFVLGLWFANPLLVFIALFLSSVIGLLVISPSLLRRNVSMQTQIPFGPMLVVGSITVFLFANQLLQFVSPV